MTRSLLMVGGSAELDVEADHPRCLAKIRAWVRSLVEPSSDIEQIATELVANARQHGDPGAIRVSVEREPAAVKVVVSNPSTSAPPTMPRGFRKVDSTAAGGRGIMLAEALADELVVEHVGDQLRVTALIPISLSPVQTVPHISVGDHGAA